MRLFTAFSLPDPVLEVWQSAQDQLKARAAGASWSPRGQAHLTLHFLGDRPDSQLPAIEAALAAVRHTPLRLTTTAVGAFPSPDHPDIPWLGVEGEGLQALVAACRGALEAIGVPLEDRAYHPHLTLARKARLTRADLASVEVPRVSWEAAEIGLYRSTLGPTGAVHQRLAGFQLTLD